jgi:predicted ATPase
MAAINARLCRFTFKDLCDNPLGAADYLAIAETFHTVFVSNIPRLNLDQLNRTRRFITFVDCMYDKGVLLHCLADASPQRLFHVEENVKKSIDEVFAFDRTASRLIEMGSVEYQKTHQEARVNGKLQLVEVEVEDEEEVEEVEEEEEEQVI